MTILAKKGELSSSVCDLLVISAFAGEQKEVLLSDAFDASLSEYLLQVIKDDHFEAKEGSTLLIRMDGRISAKRLLVVGLGKMEEVSAHILRKAFAQVQHACAGMQIKSVNVSMVGLEVAEVDLDESVQAIVEGFRLSGYTYGRYKKEEKKKTTETVEFTFSDAKLAKKAQSVIELAELVCSATVSARDLVNTPALHLAPKDMVDAAKAMVKEKGPISIKVYDEPKLKKMGAGGILGINQGSDHEPFMVHLTYKPAKKAKKVIALVGKAVTFDSGGLSLKPSDSMMGMKIDMGGAAAVLGVFSVLAKLQPNVEVHGIFGAVENMPSGKAIRPGDIVKAINGKTIEILNTDAEGRVTLADTLSYACTLKPDMVIDLATLTGACMVALGEEITGLMSNNPELAQRMLTSAKQAGEEMWELPLYKGYRQLILSDVADVKNIGGRYGGALTAGLFLQEFVTKDMPWIHMDIAGPAYAERPFNAYEQKGATGHPVRTLIHFLRSY